MTENTLVEAFSLTEAQEEIKNISKHWQLLHHGRLIAREFKFINFKEALNFTNKIGEIAESENHHPDLSLKWGLVRVEIFTHDASGLTKSDFNLASKIDQL